MPPRHVFLWDTFRHPTPAHRTPPPNEQWKGAHPFGVCLPPPPVKKKGIGRGTEGPRDLAGQRSRVRQVGRGELKSEEQSQR